MCMINTKLPSCVYIIHGTSSAAGALKALVLQTRTSRAPAVKSHDVRWIISTHSGGFVYLQPISLCFFGLAGLILKMLY